MQLDGLGDTVKFWCTLEQWWKYKFGGPGTVKCHEPLALFWGPLTDRLSGPYPDFSHLLQKWIRVRCRVMFSALGPGTDLNQAFRWKFWHFGAHERFLKVFWGPGTAFRCVPAYFHHCSRAVRKKLAASLRVFRILRGVKNQTSAEGAFWNLITPCLRPWYVVLIWWG